MNENRLVWCVDYVTAAGRLVNSKLFATEDEARSFYDQREHCPYRQMYQTRDIWHFLEKEKHGK